MEMGGWGRKEGRKGGKGGRKGGRRGKTGMEWEFASSRH